MSDSHDKQSAGKSAALGDRCVRGTPQLLSDDELKDFSRIDSLRFTGAVLVEIATLAAIIAICELWWHPLFYAFAVVVIGSRINALGGLMHDAAHRRAYRSRTFNDFVGEVIALPTSASMAGYRNSHFAHHRELNGERDPDWKRNIGLNEFEFPAPRRAMWKYLAQYLSGLKVYAALTGFHKNAETRDIPKAVTWLRLAFFVVLLIAAVAFDFWLRLVLYWLVPLFTVFLAIRYLRNVAEHYAVEHQGVLNESRTVMASPLMRWLIAPWGLNYHLEHHLFPTVPCFRLAELHCLLMTREPFASGAHISRGYFGGLFEDCQRNGA